MESPEADLSNMLAVRLTNYAVVALQQGGCASDTIRCEKDAAAT